jgi:hypothetical protein
MFNFASCKQMTLCFSLCTMTSMMLTCHAQLAVTVGTAMSLQREQDT